MTIEFNIIKMPILNNPKLTEYVEEIIKNLHVKGEYNYVKKWNPSNELPYHSWYHIECMVKNVFDGGNYYNLPRQALKHLVVAALFHDYDHTGGNCTDNVNINRATIGYMLFDKGMYQSAANASNYTEITHLINITEFPFIHNPITIEEKIIRDADLLQITEEFWYEQIVKRLGAEIQVARKTEVVTEEKMIEGQVNFLNNIKFHTNWGLDKFQNIGISRIMELKQQLLKNCSLQS